MYNKYEVGEYMTNNKILIVDDNPEIREVLNVLLSSEGYDVIEAKDGQEAIDMVSDDIDLYILDIMMPKVDGNHSAEGNSEKRKSDSGSAADGKI